MMFIEYKCKTCGKSFLAKEEDVNYSEQEGKYMTCPFYDKHKNIHVVGKYENIKECMERQRDVYNG